MKLKNSTMTLSALTLLNFTSCYNDNSTVEKNIDTDIFPIRKEVIYKLIETSITEYISFNFNSTIEPGDASNNGKNLEARLSYLSPTFLTFEDNKLILSHKEKARNEYSFNWTNDSLRIENDIETYTDWGKKVNDQEIEVTTTFFNLQGSDISQKNQTVIVGQNYSNESFINFMKDYESYKNIEGAWLKAKLIYKLQE